MHYAYVTTNVLDLWVEPRYNSERASQFLFADLVTVLEDGERWVKARLADDGYEGFVDRRFLREITEEQFRTYQKKRNVVVTVPQTPVYAGTGREVVSPHVIFYGTRLVKGVAKGSRTRVLMPDGSALYLKNSVLQPIPKASAKVRGEQLVAEVRRFLGTPYLWGGMAPTGYDCSGLAQVVCRRYGIAIPRDTKDQINVGKQIARDEVKTGDLLFFNRHTGFAVGKDKIIHCSVGGGGIRINSLRPDQPDYRPDLDKEFAQARRVTS